MRTRDGNVCRAATIQLFNFGRRFGQRRAVVEKLLKHAPRRVVEQVVAAFAHGLGFNVEEAHIAPNRDAIDRAEPPYLAVGNDRQFFALANSLGDPDLARDPRFATNTARVTHRNELKGRLDALLVCRDAHEWQEILTTAGVPCGPINSIPDAFALAKALGLPALVDIARPEGPMARQVANPVTLTRTPVSYRSAPPPVDSDRAAVLALLNMST